MKKSLSNPLSLSLFFLFFPSFRFPSPCRALCCSSSKPKKSCTADAETKSSSFCFVSKIPNPNPKSMTDSIISNGCTEEEEEEEGTQKNASLGLLPLLLLRLLLARSPSSSFFVKPTSTKRGTKKLRKRKKHTRTALTPHARLTLQKLKRLDTE